MKLVKDVETRADTLAGATETIANLGTDETRMLDIDRGADRFIAGFDRMFAEMERAFDHADVLPLSNGRAGPRRAQSLSSVGSPLEPTGRWGHVDLVGNMTELTFDVDERHGYAEKGHPCEYCANTTPRTGAQGDAAQRDRPGPATTQTSTSSATRSVRQ